MRLIDTDKIEYATDNESDCEMKLVTKEMINSMPTIDAVAVVRCKDCKTYEPIFGGTGRCVLCGLMRDNDFCSYGERRKKK